jgi:glutamyl-tRNA reductase
MNVVGISYKQAPVEIREKLLLSKEEQPCFLRRLAQSFPIDELLVLSTCNRTEIYYYLLPHSKKISATEIFNELLAFKEVSEEKFPFFVKENDESYKHFFRVSCGLEAMVLGETQILGQIKEARIYAKNENLFGSKLEFVFQKMLYILKKIRTNTKISANALSVGSTAVKLAKTIFENLSKKKNNADWSWRNRRVDFTTPVAKRCFRDYYCQ